MMNSKEFSDVLKEGMDFYSPNTGSENPYNLRYMCLSLGVAASIGRITKEQHEEAERKIEDEIIHPFHCLPTKLRVDHRFEVDITDEMLMDFWKGFIEGEV